MNALATTQQTASVNVPSFPLYGKDKNGNEVVRGTQMRFGSGQSAHSAKELRLMLKDSGMKPSAIKKQVNGVLSGKVDLSYLQAQAFLAQARLEGFVPDAAKMTSRTASLSLVKIGGTATRAKSERQIRDEAIAELIAKLKDAGVAVPENL